MTRDYFHPDTGTIVRFKGNDGEFVIIGDDAAVSDEELNDLFAHTVPEGWVKS